MASVSQETSGKMTSYTEKPSRQPSPNVPLPDDDEPYTPQKSRTPQNLRTPQRLADNSNLDNATDADIRAYVIHRIDTYATGKHIGDDLYEMFCEDFAEFENVAILKRAGVDTLRRLRDVLREGGVYVPKNKQIIANNLIAVLQSDEPSEWPQSDKDYEAITTLLESPPKAAKSNTRLRGLILPSIARQGKKASRSQGPVREPAGEDDDSQQEAEREYWNGPEIEGRVREARRDPTSPWLSAFRQRQTTTFQPHRPSTSRPRPEPQPVETQTAEPDLTAAWELQHSQERSQLGKRKSMRFPIRVSSPPNREPSQLQDTQYPRPSTEEGRPTVALLGMMVPVSQAGTTPVSQPETMPVSQPETMPVPQPGTMPFSQAGTMPVSQAGTTMPVAQAGTTMPVSQARTMPVSQAGTTMTVSQAGTMPVSQAGTSAPPEFIRATNCIIEPVVPENTIPDVEMYPEDAVYTGLSYTWGKKRLLTLANAEDQRPTTPDSLCELDNFGQSGNFHESGADLDFSIPRATTTRAFQLARALNSSRRYPGLTWNHIRPLRRFHHLDYG